MSARSARDVTNQLKINETPKTKLQNNYNPPPLIRGRLPRYLCAQGVVQPTYRSRLKSQKAGDIWLPPPIYIAEETGLPNHVKKRDFSTEPQ